MDATVLIIDDDPTVMVLLSHYISRAGFTTRQAYSIKEALLLLQQAPSDVVLTDVYLPDGNGVEFVSILKTAYPFTEIIVITSEGKISDGVKAIKNGAFDYLQKDEDSLRLISLLTAAAEKAQLQFSISVLENQVNDAASKNRVDIIALHHQQLEKATLIIKAIHSPLRQQILNLIFIQGRANVTEIYTKLNLPQAIASQHLLLLKNAGLVDSQREGKNVFYFANYTGIEKVIAFVQHLLSNN